MRVYTLKCISTCGMRDDPDDGEVIENITIETKDCVTTFDMVDNFNKMLTIMGFTGVEVEIVDKGEEV